MRFLIHFVLTIALAGVTTSALPSGFHPVDQYEAGSSIPTSATIQSRSPTLHKRLFDSISDDEKKKLKKKYNKRHRRVAKEMLELHDMQNKLNPLIDRLNLGAPDGPLAFELRYNVKDKFTIGLKSLTKKFGMLPRSFDDIKTNVVQDPEAESEAAWSDIEKILQVLNFSFKGDVEALFKKYGESKLYNNITEYKWDKLLADFEDIYRVLALAKK